ncbi:LysR family transcriptional regulator [Stutzerimonas marianensis]|uniref:LysR family transcriptional regulator n=1 Tax=Stutzerimonas marianensis TaxID=2929513 RepID=UPI003C2AE3BC
MNVSFRQLRALVMVAESASFTRAAERLHLSQPALSYTIRKLEDALGLQLLARNTRIVELTPAGQHFLLQARRMLRDMDDAVRDARDTVALTRGVVRLAALPTVAASLLPQAIADFAQIHPGIEVKLRDGRAGEMLRWVRDGDVDAGITSALDDTAGLSFEPLFDDNLMLLVREDGQRLARWTSLPYIALLPDTSIRPLADAALRAVNVDPKPAWEVAHMSSAVALVRAGLGFSLLPSSCAAVFNMQSCSVVALEHPAPRTIGLLETRPVARSPSLAAFLQFFKARLAEAQSHGN